MVVLCAAAAYYFLILLPKQRERDAQQQSAAIMEPIIRADARFSNVEVHCTAEGPFFFLSGKVRSKADLEALTKLVKDTPLLRKPDIDVRVPDKPL